MFLPVVARHAKHITFATNGEQDCGRHRGLMQFFSDPSDMHIDRARGDPPWR